MHNHNTPPQHPTEKQGPPEDEIDLRQLFSVLFKWKWLIAFLTTLSFATAALISFFVLTPVYEARTTLLVTQAIDTRQLSQRQSGNLEDVVAQAIRLPELTLQSYVNQIRNEAVAEKVIDSLGLEGIYRPNQILGMVSVSLIRDTNLVEIRVTNTNPTMARDIANAMGREYVEYMAETNIEKLSRSGELLEQQIQEEEKSLQASIERLNNFLGEARNPQVLDRESQNLLEALSHYRNAKMQIEIEIQQLQAQKNELTWQIESLPTYQSSTTPTTQVAAVTIAPTYPTGTDPAPINYELLTEQHTAATVTETPQPAPITEPPPTHTTAPAPTNPTPAPKPTPQPSQPTYPAPTQPTIQQNPNDTNQYTNQYTNPLYQTLRTQLAQKSAELAGKEAQLRTINYAILTIESEWRKIQEELAVKQTEYEQLRRETDRLSNIQNLLADKVAETRIATFVNQGETSVQVAVPANLPTSPVKPNKSLNMALGLLIGLMISVALAFVLEMLDNTIKNEEDVRRHLGLPVLGAIPKFDIKAKGQGPKGGT
ncbi:GumC family protein [Heliorestis convoluta]|nr:Wzz/FepE/Etk N-terminal domain-containing protein [Heliorestis convoluta]